MSEAARQTAKEQSSRQKRTRLKAPRRGWRRSRFNGAPRPQDVQIEILYCGVCHSDLHHVRNEWHGVMPTVYPCVPGHEIVGRVVKVGSAVKKFKEGDIAAVGCMVDSCRRCPNCLAGEEQYCDNVFTLTYNRQDKIPGRHHLRRLFGEHRRGPGVCAARVRTTSNLAGAAPLLCAGITTYSPMRHWKVRKGRKSAWSGWAGWGTWA